MKSKVLFSHAYFMRLDPKQWATAQPYGPLGTLYAAACVREQGHEVTVFDTMFEEDPASIADAISSFHPDVLVLCDDGFNYLTKMCLTNMREAAFEMIAMAKRFGCTVIISSSDATDHFNDYLEAGADFIIIGEVEQTLTELLTMIDSDQKTFDTIDGLAYIVDETAHKTKSRKVLKDLDSLPMPAWDLLDIAPYKKMWMDSSGYFSMNVATTRGCPYKCNWCAKPIYGNRYNSRSPQKVAEEIALLTSLFGIDHVWFCDDIFGLKPGWVEDFAEEVQNRKLSFRFKIQARADLLTNENYVRSLAAAGCDNIWMGAESGSQKILDAMDKGIRVEQIATATSLLKAHGIKPSFFLQFGYPGETRSDIQRTIQMVNRLLPHSIGISVAYPLPGTAFYEKVKLELTLKANWTDSNELALMFHNTYQPNFYRQLHRYVHLNHRLYTAIDYLRKLFVHPFKGGITACRKSASLVYYLPSVWFAKQKLEKLARA